MALCLAKDMSGLASEGRVRGEAGSLEGKPKDPLRDRSKGCPRDGEMERWKDHEVGAHLKTSEDNFSISLWMWGHLRICLPMASQCSAV